MHKFCIYLTRLSLCDFHYLLQEIFKSSFCCCCNKNILNHRRKRIRENYSAISSLNGIILGFTRLIKLTRRAQYLKCNLQKHSESRLNSISTKLSILLTPLSFNIEWWLYNKWTTMIKLIAERSRNRNIKTASKSIDGKSLNNQNKLLRKKLTKLTKAKANQVS